MSSFSGLTNAASALSAQNYAMQLTGQNIANANTAGYTRQTANMQELTAVAGVSRMFVTASKGGTVVANSATRTNDPVVDARARTQHAIASQADTTETSLSNVQSLFDEPSDNGMSTQIGALWTAFAGLANNQSTTSTSTQTAVVSAAATLASALNSTSTGLTTLTASTATQLSDTANQIQAAANSLATVNNEIGIASATGQDTNALADQRDQYLMTLSKLTGANATINANGTASVTVGASNTALVTANGTNAISTAATVSVSSTGAAATPYSLQVGSTSVTPTAGTAGSLVNTLNTALNPADTTGYAAQLDQVAQKLASTVNSALTSGYTSNGTAGAALFVTSNGASTFTAANISVNSALTANPALLATTSSSSGGMGNDISTTLATAGTLSTGPDAAYSSLVTGLGSAVSAASSASAIQDAVATNVDALATSASGVSYDEETTNLLMYQRAYQASARVLSTMDDVLNTLINGMGVGS